MRASRIERAVRRAVNRVLGRTNFLSFIEEFGCNPDYYEHIFGRVEVWGNGAYAYREIRFLTRDREAFLDFRERWDFRCVTDKRLAWIEQVVKERFCEEVE